MSDIETKPKPPCPECKSCEVIPLMGALPGFAPYDTADSGRMPMAQCTPSDAKAAEQWRCEGCGHEWAEGGQESEKE